jgi:hypothetical protein
MVIPIPQKLEVKDESLLLLITEKNNSEKTC